MAGGVPVLPDGLTGGVAAVSEGPIGGVAAVPDGPIGGVAAVPDGPALPLRLRAWPVVARIWCVLSQRQNRNYTSG